MAEDKDIKVLVGVTASIAAYKAAEIVRLLVKSGIKVKVVMTKNATELIGAATFRALSNDSVALEQFEDPQNSINHISLAKDYDLFLIAPASANVIAKIARGQADDLLTTTALASTAPLLIAPAMNVEMYLDDATQANLSILKSRGATIIEPDSGFLACGDIGKGRMSSPEEIVEVLQRELSFVEDMKGLKVAINAGPTREALDPVRFISNRSSGEMGYRLAYEAKRRGAEVTLISGPVNREPLNAVNFISVETADEMYEASLAAAQKADIFIATAAVADYRPETVEQNKIKRSGDRMLLSMVPNRDIIASIASDPAVKAYTVAFAAETEKLKQHALEKLKRKNVDMVAANDVSLKDRGFDSPDNEVHLFTRDSETLLKLAPKAQIASQMLSVILTDRKKGR